MKKVICTLFGCILLLGAISTPLGCQYAMRSGPEWVRDNRPEFHTDGRPNSPSGVWFASALLCVGLLAAGLISIVTESED